MIQVRFKGWGRFNAGVQRPVVKRWLTEVRAKSQGAFARGMLGPHSGNVYRRRGGDHTASVNKSGAEFPANDSGRLLASLRSHQTRNEATIGTNMFYARFLREGTGIMKRRKMSDNALAAGARAAKPKSRGWIAFQKAKKGAHPVRGL